MRLKTIIVVVWGLASVSHSALAQTVDAFGNCVSSAGVASTSAGHFTLQSEIVTTKTIPVAARLLSSRVVATGVAPVSSLNSMSTFGATSIPVGTQCVNNSVGFASSVRPFGFVPTVDVSTSVALPSTVTFSAPQVLAAPSFAVASPGIATFYANRIASENCRSSSAKVQSTATACCSPKSLQRVEDRIRTLDALLAKLEKSSRTPSSGGSEEEVDEMLDETRSEQPAPTPAADDFTDLLKDTTK
tara:strand:- start:191001 stop:191735 length:735 start_codon:yes stop_codon:yes gene_type:complete